MCPSAADQWLRKSCVWEEAQHGGSINGNGCKRLLERIDFLQQICTSGACPAIGGLQFVPVLRAFKTVVHSCFSYTLAEGWLESIENFKTEFLALNIRVTPKVHAVMFHVSEFCLKHGKGLGMFSEQASESVHANFKLTWERFSVAKVHPSYGAQLRRAVTDYNAQHI